MKKYIYGKKERILFQSTFSQMVRYSPIIKPTFKNKHKSHFWEFSLEHCTVEITLEAILNFCNGASLSTLKTTRNSMMKDLDCKEDVI